MRRESYQQYRARYIGGHPSYAREFDVSLRLHGDRLAIVGGGLPVVGGGLKLQIPWSDFTLVSDETVRRMREREDRVYALGKVVWKTWFDDVTATRIDYTDSAGNHRLVLLMEARAAEEIRKKALPVIYEKMVARERASREWSEGKTPSEKREQAMRSMHDAMQPVLVPSGSSTGKASRSNRLLSPTFYAAVRMLAICVSGFGLLLCFGGILLAFSGGLGYLGLFFGLPGFFVAVIGGKMEEWAKNKKIEEELRPKMSEGSGEGPKE